MYRFVKSHLDGTNDIVQSDLLQKLICRVGRAEIREDQGVHLFVVQLGEGIFPVTQFLVQGVVELHLAVNYHVGIAFM